MIKKYLSLTWVLVVLVLIGGLVSKELYRENRSLKKEVADLKSDPQLIAKEETKLLIAKLSKLVVLPEGEDPVVATVTDKEKLKDQPIFANAENGDKLIIYSTAKKAYLYDETNNKVKDIIPVNLGDEGKVAGTSTDAPLRLVLVNGTQKAGATADLEQKLKEAKVSGVTVTSRALAKRRDYEKSVVVDVTGKNKEAAASLAKILSMNVGLLPEGESTPSADLAVFIGADFK